MFLVTEIRDYLFFLPISLSFLLPGGSPGHTPQKIPPDNRIIDSALHQHFLSLHCPETSAIIVHYPLPSPHALQIALSRTKGIAIKQPITKKRIADVQIMRVKIKNVEYVQVQCVFDFRNICKSCRKT